MMWPFSKKQKRTYVDYAASTPVASFVMKKMRDASVMFANPSSIHTEGVLARRVLEDGRTRVARTVMAQPDEIIFTASGTESCVIALRGVVAHAKRHMKQPHIIVSSIEHSAVLETARDMERLGDARVTYVEPDEQGVVRPEYIKQCLTDETVLVSVIMVHNETGTIQPIREIGLLLRKHKRDNGYPLLHSDGSQALLYVDVSVLTLHVDLLTLDGLKCYGPRGVGVLFKKRGVMLDTPITGGRQEGGMRSGTENIGAINGLARAFEYACQVRSHEVDRVGAIRVYAKKRVSEVVPSAMYNEGLRNSPHILSVCFPGSDAEYVVISLDALGIACAWGSACKSVHGDTTSTILMSMHKEACARSTVRFSFGRETTFRDIDVLCDALSELVHRGVITRE